jgi:hypothetical protein
VRWGVLCLVLSICLAAAVHAEAQLTIYHIDDNNGSWGSCSNCAGGNNLAELFWIAPFQTVPSHDGASTEFHIDASKPYANALYWRKLGAQDWGTHFTWDFWIYLTDKSLGAQSLEYDMVQFVGGREYTFGSQCVYASGRWDVWNQRSGSWVQTSLPCYKFSPYVWHHIVWQVHRTSDTNMHYDSLTLDGVQHTLNITEPSGPLPSGWTDNLCVQWQLDTGGSSQSFSEWVDNVKLTIR